MNLIEEKKPKLFYGYVIVAACFSIMAIIHGTMNTFGVFFTPLLMEFSSTRAALSAASSLAFFIMGFAAILIGVLMDKFGPRLVLTACTFVFSAGYLLMSRAGMLWQIYLFFVVIGIGLSASDVVPLATVVRWFIRKRGVMSGIMKVGTGLGMMAMPLIANGLIGSLGWRMSYVVLGVLVLVTVLPLSQLVRRDPQEKGLLPDGDKQSQIESSNLTEEGLTFRKAINTRQLWMVCGFYGAIIFCAQSILVHIVPHSLDLGVSAAVAAGIAATIGGTSMPGRVIMGFTGDRIGNKRAMAICFLILITAMLWLQVARESWMLYLFAAVYGFSHGGFFALISPLVAGFFGTRSQGTLLGIVIFSGTFCGSISPILTGRIFDTTGSYQLAFLILLILAIIGLIFTMLLKPIRT